jgi:hypothetical protein
VQAFFWQASSGFTDILKIKPGNILMSLKKIGTVFPKDTRSKIWWIKLALCLILSNIFFFLIFGSQKEAPKISSSTINWVEIQMEAEVLTPLIEGKKVLLINRRIGKKIEGVLKKNEALDSGKITVSVREEEAEHLIQHSSWLVLPFLKKLTLASSHKIQNKVIDHEIHY